MADALTPGSPEAWLQTLNRQLEARRSAIDTYEAYYEGAHPLAFATAKFREAFGNLFDAFADNWCELVVGASVERLRVQGFRFGEEGQEGDEDAWTIWQRNGLDRESRLAHTEAVKTGCAYTIVDRDEDGKALITTEHPSQVIVATAPGNRRFRRAALKKWLDDETGYAMATVYLPDAAYKFQSEKEIRGSSTPETTVAWVPRDGTDRRVENPLGVVPVVPLENNPTMLAGGQSDLKKVVPLQNGINKLVTDMIVASEFAAFLQRWATGIEIPKDPETGQPLDREKWLSAVSRMWAVPDENAKFGQFDATDLGNYVKGVEMLVQHFCAQTHTPPHYVLGEIVNASGDALKASETGLVAKVRGKIEDFSDPWEETMRLAFKIEGDDARANDQSAETIWADPEVRTEGEMTDAAVKQRTLGIPLEVLWERLGYTPQQIARMKTLTGLPDRPPPGATTADVPPLNTDGSQNGSQADTAASAAQ